MNKENKDGIILESLKLAIVDAFFNPKQIYNNQTGAYMQYGGQVVEVIQKILGMEEIKKMVEEIAKEVVLNKGIIKVRVKKEIETKILGEVEKQIKNDQYYFSNLVQDWIREHSKKIVSEELENDRKIRELIKKKIGEKHIDDFEIEKRVEIDLRSKS